MSDHEKSIHEILRDIAIWAVTGVSAFLAYNVWQVSVSVEKLVVEMKYLAQNDGAAAGAFIELQKDLMKVKQQQMSSASTLYQITNVEKRLGVLEKDMLSRTGRRWMLADQTSWVKEFRMLNPSLNVPPAEPH